MADGLAVYRTDLVDSARWQRLPLRPGDIVISTTAKSGTTWMQMICALLDLNINHDAIRGHRGVHGPKRRTQNVREFLLEWMRGGMTGSLDHVASQLNKAWRRREMPNTVLVHYADLSAMLETEMRKLAARLDVTVPADRWPSLVAPGLVQWLHRPHAAD